MSAVTDNINFLTGVLSDVNLNVTQNTYGLWVSTFENVNVNENGYAFPEFLVEDIIALPFALTGTVWTLPDNEGNLTKSRFFISSGVKGESYEETIQIIADITDSYISGVSPYIFMPGIDFSGKIYRRYEITGINVSRFSNKELLVISGEDWEDTKLFISGNNADFIYGYQDTGYSGYSNEVSTRYKFLYDDSRNSPVKNSFSFDPPSQVEEGSSFQYRVSRKSDPFGSFFPAQTNANGQLLINLQNDEVSEQITSSINYNFSTPEIISFSSDETKTVFEDSVSNIKSGFDESVTGVELSRADSNLQLDLLASGSYSGIYRVNVVIEESKSISPITKIGYVMSGYNASGIGSGIINIAINSGVYPRVLQDGGSYNYTDFMTKAEASDRLEEQQETKYESTNEDESEEKNTLMMNEDLALLNNNQESPPIKSFLLNFPLPKKIISKDYYTNYLNSGETYIITPISAYSKPVFVSCGNESLALGRALGAQEVKLINPTALGLRIDEVSFCKGDSGLDDYRKVPDDIYFENGTVTRIPSDGIIKKENYENKEAWLNAINYFYTKNYVSSFTIYPTLAKSAYSDFFAGALSKVKKVISAPDSKNTSENSFHINTNGIPIPRIFVEREIYTEPYNESQISEFNRSFTSGSKIATGSKLTTVQNERLYCVQSYGDFPKDPKSFFPTQNYNENLTFKKFLEHSDLSGYTTGDSIGRLLFNAISDKDCIRVEYATGLNSAFSYDSYSGAVAWTGLNGAAISIANQDVKNYAYHLYSHTETSDPLTFNKSNIKNNDPASVISGKAAVLKFSKKNFENASSTEYVEDQLFQASYPSIVDSSFALVDPALIRFNIQIYEYKLSSSQINQWSIFNKNPINDNNYQRESSQGLVIPGFFEEAALEIRNSSAALFNFPNGPFTSKNHEGTPIGGFNIAPLSEGLFENNIIVTEESKHVLSYESNCVLDFANNNRLVKQLSPTNPELISLSNTRRLKVTKIKYNFYTKNLVIIGDAGSRNSIYNNGGWKFELQYRKTNQNADWKKVTESNEFLIDEISCNFGVIPSEYLGFGQEVHFLSMVAFEVNLPLFLDDNDYEFKIVKYERLGTSTSSVEVVKKTNFIPIQASWSGNAACSRFDIYQKDTGNNLTLLGSELVLKTYSYAVPDVKQSYIDMGLANFGSLNYSGYYDIVVSGIMPSTAKILVSLSGEYGFKVGDTSSDLKASRVSDLNTVTTAVLVSGVTYSPMLNFNNPESKNSTFEINQNHNGYYFVTDSATSTLNGITGQVFEAYVANTGSSNCSVGGATLSSGYVAAVSGALPIVTSALQVLDSASLSLNNIIDNDVIYLKNNFTLLNPTDGKKFYLINDSASIITGSYSGTNYSFAGGKTFRMDSAASALTTGLTLSNVNIQDDYIYSNTGLTNFDHLNLTLSSAVTNLPVYNASRSSLKINNVTTLASDSFNLVTWDGANAPSGDLKNYFDGIRIYLKGEEDYNLTTLLKDDTEIIITHFTKDTSNTYYFLKDESVNRDLNIKIINGTSTTLIPSQKQDFKLIVTRDTNGINFKMTYASANPDVAITEAREQLIILKGDSSQTIDLKNAENFLYQNSFVYFVNKSSEDASFTYGIEKTALSQNQIARVSLDSFDAVVEILTQARSHFKFDIDPTTHLSSTINILNLDFCDTEINFPDVSNFNGKETFLICKNRLFPNKIDTSSLLYSSSLLDNFSVDETNEFKNLGLDSMFLNVRKKESFHSFPTISTISFLDLNHSKTVPIVPKETTPNSQAANYFYVNETGLSDFTLRDFYNRKTSYEGKIFFPKSQVINIRSFDEKNSIPNLESRSFSFDYDPDGDINGRLEALRTSDEIVLSYESEKGSTQIEFSRDTVHPEGSIYANFAYDTAIATVPADDASGASATLKKNRLAVQRGSSLKVFPIYNKDEFFIAKKIKIDDLTVYDRNNNKNIYYIISAYTIDVNSIIIPDDFGADDVVIRNNSSRSYSIKSLSNNYSFSILPNTQKKFTYTSSWTASDNADNADNIVWTEIQSFNQGFEIDPDHPLFGLWETNVVDFLNKFIPNFVTNDFSLEDGVNKYEIIDVDPGSVMNESATLGIYCYGRKAKTQVALAGRPYFVNTFYLYADFAGSIVKRNEFYFQGSVEPLTVIERQHVDLLKYFKDSNIDSLPSVIFIPITSHLITYYLPNLSQSFKVDNVTRTLGSIIDGKKIIFVNLVRCSASAANQVKNHFSASSQLNSTDLLRINSVSVYEVDNGVEPYISQFHDTGVWDKVHSGIPVVKTIYPTLKGVEGVSATSDSISTNGNEIVYLSNFDKFYIEKASFKNNTYESFYLYNSCGYSITVKEIGKKDLLFNNLAKFSKISIDAGSGTFKSENIVSGGLPSLISTTDPIIDRKFKSGTIIKLTIGTARNIAPANEKAVYVTDKSIKVYKCDQTGTPEGITIENICTLDLSDLKTYASNDKLFIYGSSRVNEAGLSFDSYDLTLLNVDKLADQKFYIHNASKSILKIFIDKLTFVLPVARTLEISKDGISYMQTHSKGMFYTSTKVTNKNYLSKSKINIFADALIDHDFSKREYFNRINGNSNLNEQVNVGVSLLQDSGESPDIYVYDFSNFKSPQNLFLSLGILLNIDSDKKTYFILNNGQLMSKNIYVFNIKKPSISVSTAGHYIVNDNNNDISATVGSEIFLVNNSVKDVSVKLSSGANLSPTLFRNTVLVINSSGGIRYLKKAKRRDEFYCVFNPKTMTSLTDKEAKDKVINRTKDVLPIFYNFSSEFPQASYVKLLDKGGQSRFVRLSIRDYYNGVDIPTDSPENILAYEIGIGHEVIYKFLFFDPSESIYTLPGIENGSTYIVEADTNLFYNLTNINGDLFAKITEDPYVKYNGKEYRDGETFIGVSVSNYEIKYPNYVKVAKIIQKLEKTFDKFEGQPDEAIDPEITKEVVDKPKEGLALKEAILGGLRTALGGVEYWLPTNTSAFWQDSDFEKDIFTITEVFPSETKSIITQDGTQYVYFVKCSMEKTNLRETIQRGSITHNSALQFKYPVFNPESLTIGMGDDWGPEKREAFVAQTKANYNDVSTILEPILKARLAQRESSDNNLDIFITIEKLQPMPTVEFEDFSESEIIKLLNEKEMAVENVIEDTEVENE